jgi:hypothetical protein
MKAAILIGVVMLAGCSAKYPEGVLACTKQSDCPSGWVCRVDRYCYSTARTAAAGEEASSGGNDGSGGLGGIGAILKH